MAPRRAAKSVASAVPQPKSICWCEGTASALTGRIRPWKPTTKRTRAAKAMARPTLVLVVRCLSISACSGALPAAAPPRRVAAGHRAEPAAADDHDLVDGLGGLREHVARDEHRAPLLRE